MFYSRNKLYLLFACLLTIFIILPNNVVCSKKVSHATSSSSNPQENEVEPVIEEVTAKQLERILQDKDFVAVYWCK